MEELVNKSYAQASRNNIKEIFKIKDIFSKLFLNKVLEIHNVINKLSQKSKAKLNITTKDSFRKQIIIFMGTNNTKRVMVQSNIYITNINRLFKDIKWDTSADFIYTNSKRIIITMNKIATLLDLKVVEKYMKELNNIDTSNVISLRLSQSKLYLKILDILYLIENTNLSITVNIIEKIIQISYIFNNTVLASHPHIIKALPKFDRAVIWMDIWDS